MIKHKTTGLGWKNLIEKAEVERETESSVWIGGRRSAKISSYECYFDTFGEAKSYLLDMARKHLERANGRVSYAEKELDEVIKLAEEVEK